MRRLFCLGRSKIKAFCLKLAKCTHILAIGILMAQAVFSMGHKVDLETAVDEAVQRYGLRNEPAMMRAFQEAHVAYPPKQVTLLAFKQERQIELWAKDERDIWKYVRTYPLTAFSGHLGPKLRERDGQIPEGIYRLTTFNPFSSMHLSMMIDYPNYFDRAQAAKEGRRRLGSHIFLHGKALSAGCLAVGDKAIDQLFLLARRVGLSHIKLIISPNDLRHERPATSMFAQPRWLPDLYKKISIDLSAFKRRSKEV